MEKNMPQERLLILMSLAKLHDEEMDEAKKLAKQVDDWDLFWELSYTNRVVPLVKSNLEKIGAFSALPPSIQDKFIKRSNKIREMNKARLQAGVRFMEKLRENQIPVVILKGVNFAETIYKNPHYKRMNDIDLLVKPEDLQRIYPLLETLDFFSIVALTGGSEKHNEKRSHHAAYINRSLTCMVGLHWKLINPLSPFHYDYEAIWSRVSEFPIEGTVAGTMAPEDNLHHVCVHLPYYKTGLRELADIYNLIRQHRDALDWDLLLATIEKADTHEPMFHALSLANRICSIPELEKITGALRSRCSGRVVADTQMKTADLSLLLRNRSTHQSVIEKAFSSFNATKEAKEKFHFFIKVWKAMLFPPVFEIVKMNYLKNPSPAAILYGRLTTPIRIFRLICRELGTGIFALALLKSTFDMCASAVQALFSQSKGQIDYETYAREIGITKEGLERFKAGIE